MAQRSRRRPWRRCSRADDAAKQRRRRPTRGRPIHGLVARRPWRAVHALLQCGPPSPAAATTLRNMDCPLSVALALPFHRLISQSDNDNGAICFSAGCCCRARAGPFSDHHSFFVAAQSARRSCAILGAKDRRILRRRMAIHGQERAPSLAREERVRARTSARLPWLAPALASLASGRSAAFPSSAPTLRPSLWQTAFLRGCAVAHKKPRRRRRGSALRFPTARTSLPASSAEERIRAQECSPSVARASGKNHGFYPSPPVSPRAPSSCARHGRARLWLRCATPRPSPGARLADWPCAARALVLRAVGSPKRNTAALRAAALVPICSALRRADTRRSSTARMRARAPLLVPRSAHARAHACLRGLPLSGPLVPRGPHPRQRPPAPFDPFQVLPVNQGTGLAFASPVCGDERLRHPRWEEKESSVFVRSIPCLVLVLSLDYRTFCRSASAMSGFPPFFLPASRAHVALSSSSLSAAPTLRATNRTASRALPAHTYMPLHPRRPSIFPPSLLLTR